MLPPERVLYNPAGLELPETTRMAGGTLEAHYTVPLSTVLNPLEECLMPHRTILRRNNFKSIRVDDNWILFGFV
jgi:hypothetical protein